MRTVSACTNCGSKNQYRSREVSAGGGHAPNYLPGLGGFWKVEKFTVIVCSDCGLTRFFARPEATAQVSASEKWTRV